jgi:hypothetical protein
MRRAPAISEVTASKYVRSVAWMYSDVSAAAAGRQRSVKVGGEGKDRGVAR